MDSIKAGNGGITLNMNRKHISCDVCLDLIPLVVDHVASNDSKALVYHVKQKTEQSEIREARGSIPKYVILSGKGSHW